MTNWRDAILTIGCILMVAGGIGLLINGQFFGVFVLCVAALGLYVSYRNYRRNRPLK